MDSPYSRFLSYDFQRDARFQQGLEKVSHRDLLELQIFYYNRFIEPIDLTGFQKWRDGQRGLRAASDGAVAAAMEPKGQKDEIRGPEESDEEPEPAQDGSLPFAEVFRRIQAGEEIPGLQKLDIKPCLQQPTVSQMSRRLKPWEKQNVSLETK